jgi:hypothetical protein
VVSARHGVRPAPHRSPAGPAQHVDGRRVHRGLVPEAPLRLLAAGDGDPQGRHGRQPANRAGSVLAVAAPDAAAASTHSLLGAAAAEILRRFTGTNSFGFCMVSTTSVPTGSERCWDSFTQAELENAESRVLVGFHFRSAITTGVKVGRQVGQFAMQHALLPLSVIRGTHPVEDGQRLDCL